jgi:hypothetical protein
MTHRPNKSAPSEVDNPAAPEQPEGEKWVTLAEAAEAAAVSVSAIRKWYRSGLRSRLAPGPTGQRREVELSEVLERAGRRIGPTPPKASPIPEGMALVPAATWQRYLDISVAYAEAGERVGRAEATAEQYRSRLEEYRARVAALEEQLAAARTATETRRRWWRR